MAIRAPDGAKNRGLGNPSKTLGGFFSVKGGYIPIPLSFFGQKDFLLTGGDGTGVPPISLWKKSTKNSYFRPKTLILALFDHFY